MQYIYCREKTSVNDGCENAKFRAHGAYVPLEIRLIYVFPFVEGGVGVGVETGGERSGRGILGVARH